MTDPYPGSAGNLPRLFIPAMAQVQDPNVQRALQGILQWANSLDAVVQLLAGSGITLSPADGQGTVEVSASGGSGSGLVNYASYQFFGSFPGALTPIPWTPVKTNNFDYLNPGSTDITPPADTITLLALNGAIDVFTPFSNSSLSLEWEGASATVYGLIANQLFESDATFETAWNPSFDCTYDSAAADTPLQLIPRDAGTTDPTHLLLNLDILSFTTP
jgi:hypothetical protein